MLARNHSAVEDLAIFEDVLCQSLDKHVIQWYPGHIAKAERQLKGQLNKVDIVFDVRDARIIRSTMHPQMIEWTASKRRFLLVNRIDMVSKADLSRWKRHFSNTDERVFYTNGQSGTGIEAIIRASEKLSSEINANRTRRGLKPRAVRACVVGFPNIGKSALINRLLHRRVVMSAAMPGVTRVLRWVRMGESLDLLDSPGIIPGSIRNQQTATKLAICNDIGEASYVHSAVAAAFLSLLPDLPGSKQIIQRLEARYNRKLGEGTSEDFLWHLADSLFQGDPEQAGQRILKDYRDLRLGPFSLESPP
jgi:ribosome biogenesis GTP-binding protein YlqF